MSNINKEVTITEFEVASGGTLTIADYWGPKSRADFYESLSDWWSGSPEQLMDAMNECQPLAWAVHAIYTEIRDEVQEELDGDSGSSIPRKDRSAALNARLKTMPEEPEEGVATWLLGLTTTEFEWCVVPVIEKWFEAPPDWNWEDDYLPRGSTSQSAALEFFQELDRDQLRAIGVVIVEGEHPGSTYYAAELTLDIDVANNAAAEAGIPVRFKKSEA